MVNARWRLIHSRPSSGAYNMAVDEAILESVGQRLVPPTLRLYAWNPPCLSLGYAQPSSDVDQQALLQNSWHLVRRPTGGRAILHADELTYSVIAPLNDPVVSGPVLESYSRISQALLNALQILSLHARADKTQPLPNTSQPDSPVCFEVPSSYEITVNQKKLIGSAQSRRRDGVLQHGSLPLSGDLSRITCALVYPDQTTRQENARRLLEHATTLENVLGHSISWETAASAFEQAFIDTFHIDLQLDSLSPTEEQRAESLLADKYANSAWTYRL
jgi:lipoyl(octanoyl) transferase